MKINEELKEVAREFNEDNVPLNVIVKKTGLTLQEVEAL